MPHPTEHILQVNGWDYSHPVNGYMPLTTGGFHVVNSPEQDRYAGISKIRTANVPHVAEGLFQHAPFQDTFTGSIERKSTQYQMRGPIDWDIFQLLQAADDMHSNGKQQTQLMPGMELEMELEDGTRSTFPPPNAIANLEFEHSDERAEGRENTHTRMSLSPPAFILSSGVPSPLVTPAALELLSVGTIESPGAEDETDVQPAPTGSLEAKTRKHQRIRRPFGEACDRCSRRKISCIESAGGHLPALDMRGDIPTMFAP
ncbi:hypothetical protein CERSUDRAFT_95600 [Gelatoporia subvermispora B]|uniref:Uncharacterized protein n=1 Tax=Ceriporiopsis subvermispora (strain B) TaxID=914234 RepID=M2RBT2_CERS8|nr:hypothetical protein CERSUDRAFT_95600 [Gelatoporia subvermispora B]